MGKVFRTISGGKGEPALKYLSRYLYRGMISENNILSDEKGEVTFRYIDSDTGKTEFRTIPGLQFVRLILKHFLPTGFGRVRDYGFLHGNAKKKLNHLQLLLLSKIKLQKPVKRSIFKCPNCGHKMQILQVRVIRLYMDQRYRSPPVLMKPVA